MYRGFERVYSRNVRKCHVMWHRQVSFNSPLIWTIVIEM